MDRHQCIAVRLMRLLPGTRIKHPPDCLRTSAIVAGLLLDLRFAGRISDCPDAVHVDARPTGFEPVDVLLRSIADTPGRPARYWLDHAQPTLGLLGGRAQRATREAARRCPPASRLLIGITDYFDDLHTLRAITLHGILFV